MARSLWGPAEGDCDSNVVRLGVRQTRTRLVRVSVVCQLDRLCIHLGGQALGIFMRESLDWITEGGETHPKHEQ